MDIIAKDLAEKKASLKKALHRVEVALSHKKRRRDSQKRSLELAKSKLLLALDCLRISETALAMAHFEATWAGTHMADGIRTYTKSEKWVTVRETKVA